MKQARWMLMVLAALLLSIGIASAELNYILPDSNSRELTWDEVARWDYETCLLYTSPSPRDCS